jgi:hypothetical protein
MTLDQLLIFVALGAYVAGSIALITYFLSRSSVMRTAGIVLAVTGCVAQFAELGVRWATTGSGRSPISTDRSRSLQRWAF